MKQIPAMKRLIPIFPRMITGLPARWIFGLIMLQYLLLAWKHYGDMRSARNILATIMKLKDDFLGSGKINKIIFTGSRFFYNMHIPGFPSRIMVKNILREFHKISPIKADQNRLRILFIGITNKCPLQCKHCYEWFNLKKPDMLGTGDLKEIIGRFVDKGVGQVHLGGGEPMLKYQALLEIIRCFKHRTELWVATSGLGFSYQRAVKLKEAGLTGVAISLDHYEEQQHNAFRGSDKSYNWAMNATHCALRAGLLTSWSLCATREFTSEENLARYAKLAASKGVHFIQIFEAVPSGRYSDQDVRLFQKHCEVLEKFYLTYNSDKKFRKMPMVTYHGYHQRRMGCMGRGDTYLYIDAEGNLHPCPFCRSSQSISVLGGELEELLGKLSNESCLLI